MGRLRVCRVLYDLGSNDVKPALFQHLQVCVAVIVAPEHVGSIIIANVTRKVAGPHAQQREPTGSKNSVKVSEQFRMLAAGHMDDGVVGANRVEGSIGKGQVRDVSAYVLSGGDSLLGPSKLFRSKVYACDLEELGQALSHWIA
jgi:hypothetical protein